MADFEFPGIKPLEAIDFLRRRLALGPDAWADLVAEVDASARARSSSMSGAMAEGVLEAILQALDEGTTAATFREDFDELAVRHGWSGDNEDGWRSTLIFRTQTMQALAAGRWRQIQEVKKFRPYLRYVAVMDSRTRQAHAAWHDVILPVDHPWWDTHFPPNGFNCRCRVMSLSDRNLARWNLKLSDEAPPLDMVEKKVRTDDGYELVEVPAGIDPGFAIHIGKLGLKLPPAAS